ncbi:unnamed protein product [Rotaria sordida]|uniref:Uncharacterized protein n=1 Tax=Rotaria sordida TaxID=392033 RepID=A0A819WPK4_9BILA|nr:unnamed protein product [Rotaria sordida]
MADQHSSHESNTPHGDSLQNQPNTTVSIRTLLEQNNMLRNDNTNLHQQVQHLVLQLNQQQIDSDRQLQETLFNLSESNRMLTIELNQIKKEIFNLTEENNRVTQENTYLKEQIDDLKQENLHLKKQVDDLKQENMSL